VLIADSERLEADKQFSYYPNLQFWHKSYPIEYRDEHSHVAMAQFLRVRETDFSREIHNMAEFDRVRKEEGTRVVVFLESYNEELEFINEICKDYLGMVKFYHVWNDQLQRELDIDEHNSIQLFRDGESNPINFGQFLTESNLYNFVRDNFIQRFTEVSSSNFQKVLYFDLPVLLVSLSANATDHAKLLSEVKSLDQDQIVVMYADQNSDEAVKQKMGVQADDKPTIKLVWFQGKEAQRHEVQYKGQITKQLIKKFVKEQINRLKKENIIKPYEHVYLKGE